MARSASGPARPSTGSAGTAGRCRSAILGEPFDGRPGCNNCSACQSGCPTGRAPRRLADAVAEGDRRRRAPRPQCPGRGDRDRRDGRATGAVYIDRDDRRPPAAGGRPRGPLRQRHRHRAAPSPLGQRPPAERPRQFERPGRAQPHAPQPRRSSRPGSTSRSRATRASSAARTSARNSPRPTRRAASSTGFTLHMRPPQRRRLPGARRRTAAIARPGARGITDWFREHFSRGFGVLVVGDDLPQPTNRVTLSETVKDSSGLPAAHIDYRLHENDERLHPLRHRPRRRHRPGGRCLRHQGQRLPHGRRATTIRRPGTCSARRGWAPIRRRPWSTAGTRRGTCPNLYIVDGSSLPSGAAVNPTSTISALALRAARHIAANSPSFAGSIGPGPPEAPLILLRRPAASGTQL